MAAQKLDREDLFRDATALVVRVAIAPTGGGEPVLIGFRADGAVSVYFGSEPAYHFNSQGELRRAYSEGLLFKAEQGKLISLERTRRVSEVQLVRRPLNETEQAKFLADIRDRLRSFVDDYKQGKLIVVGQVPADTDVMGRALAWLSQGEQNIEVADSPHAR
jgi:hypothetical protein